VDVKEPDKFPEMPNTEETGFASGVKESKDTGAVKLIVRRDESPEYMGKKVVVVRGTSNLFPDCEGIIFKEADKLSNLLNPIVLLFDNKFRTIASLRFSLPKRNFMRATGEYHSLLLFFGFLDFFPTAKFEGGRQPVASGGWTIIGAEGEEEGDEEADGISPDRTACWRERKPPGGAALSSLNVGQPKTAVADGAVKALTKNKKKAVIKIQNIDLIQQFTCAYLLSQRRLHMHVCG
jgi:hypothetical protein